jgi:hypothetical protein
MATRPGRKARRAPRRSRPPATARVRLSGAGSQMPSSGSRTRHRLARCALTGLSRRDNPDARRIGYKERETRGGTGHVSGPGQHRPPPCFNRRELAQIPQEEIWLSKQKRERAPAAPTRLPPRRPALHVRAIDRHSEELRQAGHKAVIPQGALHVRGPTCRVVDDQAPARSTARKRYIKA